MLIGTKRILLTTKVKSVASTSLLLDTLSVTSFIAYSTRKLKSSYAGNALKVTTSASGNGTQNIGFVNGDLDTGSLSTFLSSNNGTVDTWYDQSGSTSGGNASRSGTVSQQPMIYSSGGALTQGGHVWSLGTSATFFPISGSSNISQPFAVATVAKLDNSAAAFFATFGGAGCVGGGNSGHVSYIIGLPNGSFTPDNSADANPHSVIFYFNGASSNVYLDGTALGTQGTPSGTAQFIFGDEIMWNTSNSCHIGELIGLVGTPSSSDIATIHSSHKTWWGTP